MSRKHNFTVAGVIFGLGAAAAASAQDATRPNVIFILADDLGYGDLGCYGQRLFGTPGIDSLAASGLRFTGAYSGTTVSAPSRACLLTGMHSGHAPVRGNIEVSPEGQFPLPEGTENIFRLFSRAGYVTAAFGKWGLGSPGSEGDPLNQGVDRFFGYNCQLLAHNYYPDHIWDDSVRVDLPENAGGAFGAYAQDLIHEEGLRFLEANRDSAMFVFFPYILPHAELLVPEDSLMQSFRGRYPETPFRGCDSGPVFRKGGYCSQPEPHAAFAAMVARLDRYVGEIVAKLKELGIYDNTVIIFASDNGPHLEGGADPDFFDSNGIFRGYKRDLYEGGIRVPLIISWPGHTRPGSETSVRTAFWDFYPTFRELLSQDGTEADGRSILPLLNGATRMEDPEFLYFEFHEDNGRQAVLSGRWKLVRLNASLEPERQVWELYDLEADPSESRNLLSEDNVTGRYRKTASRLRRIMLREHRPDPNWPLLREEKR